MELNFKSDADFNYEGLDLVVSAVSRSGHNVVVNGLGKNGTLVGETNDILPGEVVKLTVTPNDGYFLYRISPTADGEVLTIDYSEAVTNVVFFAEAEDILSFRSLLFKTDTLVSFPDI